MAVRGSTVRVGAAIADPEVGVAGGVWTDVGAAVRCTEAAWVGAATVGGEVVGVVDDVPQASDAHTSRHAAANDRFFPPNRSSPLLLRTHRQFRIDSSLVS